MKTQLDMERPFVIELQYLGPIHAYARMYHASKVIFDQYEHFEKGSYRNRAYIAGTQGPLLLSIPLKKGKNEQCPVKEVEIQNATKWQHQHWQSICSFYRSSPYFEFYEHYFAPFYQKEYTYYTNFVYDLHETIIRILGIEKEFSRSETYIDPSIENIDDWRGAIHPKKHRATRKDSQFIAPEYHQVFQENTGFYPNLSIIDLLFNMGPESVLLLKSSIKE